MDKLYSQLEEKIIKRLTNLEFKKLVLLNKFYNQKYIKYLWKKISKNLPCEILKSKGKFIERIIHEKTYKINNIYFNDLNELCPNINYIEFTYFASKSILELPFLKNLTCINFKNIEQYIYKINDNIPVSIYEGLSFLNLEQNIKNFNLSFYSLDELYFLWQNLISKQRDISNTINFNRKEIFLINFFNKINDKINSNIEELLSKINKIHLFKTNFIDLK